MTLVLLLRPVLGKVRCGLLGSQVQASCLGFQGHPTALAAVHATCPPHAGHSAAAHHPTLSQLDQLVASGTGEVIQIIALELKETSF